MTEPAAIDPETPCVTADGKQWPIPVLVWRDLRKCRHELIELNNLINDALVASSVDPEESVAQRGLRQMSVMAGVLDSLSNEAFDRLVMGPVHAGLAAAHPSMTRAEFDALAMTETERQLAWLTVRKQSGLFLYRDGEPSGEAGGAA